MSSYEGEGDGKSDLSKSLSEIIVVKHSVRTQGRNKLILGVVRAAGWWVCRGKTDILTILGSWGYNNTININITNYHLDSVLKLGPVGNGSTRYEI